MFMLAHVMLLAADKHITTCYLGYLLKLLYYFFFFGIFLYFTFLLEAVLCFLHLHFAKCNNMGILHIITLKNIQFKRSFKSGLLLRSAPRSSGQRTKSLD